MTGTKRFKAGNGRVGRQLEALRHTVVSVQLALSIAPKRPQRDCIGHTRARQIGTAALTEQRRTQSVIRPDVRLAQLEYPSAGSTTTSRSPGWAESEERAGDAEARLGQPLAG
jgi:hypothetical protein